MMSDKKEAPSYKYGVDSLAEDLGVQATTVRVMLRKHSVEKTADRVYGWNTQTDYKAVLAKLRPKSEDKAPAKTVAAKKPAAKKTKDE